MGLAYTKDSAYAKEVAKWEALPGDWGPGLRPYVYREFPKMLYQVKRATTGGRIEIADQRVAGDEQQELNLKSRDYIELKDAEAWLKHREHGVAELAAERAYVERRMSPAAQAEAAAADEATTQHLPSVPVTPVRRRRAYQPTGKKRGRPANVALAESSDE